MGGERIRQPQHRGELRAKQARAQNPDWNMEPCAGNRLDNLHRLKGTEEGLQLQHVLREGVRAGRIAPQRAKSALVGAGSATEPKIDPPG